MGCGCSFGQAVEVPNQPRNQPPTALGKAIRLPNRPRPSNLFPRKTVRKYTPSQEADSDPSDAEIVDDSASTSTTAERCGNNNDSDIGSGSSGSSADSSCQEVTQVAHLAADRNGELASFTPRVPSTGPPSRPRPQSVAFSLAQHRSTAALVSGVSQRQASPAGALRGASWARSADTTPALPGAADMLLWEPPYPMGNKSGPLSRTRPNSRPPPVPGTLRWAPPVRAAVEASLETTWGVGPSRGPISFAALLEAEKAAIAAESALSSTPQACASPRPTEPVTESTTASSAGGGESGKTAAAAAEEVAAGFFARKPPGFFCNKAAAATEAVAPLEQAAATDCLPAEPELPEAGQASAKAIGSPCAEMEDCHSKQTSVDETVVKLEELAAEISAEVLLPGSQSQESEHTPSSKSSTTLSLQPAAPAHQSLQKSDPDDALQIQRASSGSGATARADILPTAEDKTVEKTAPSRLPPLQRLGRQLAGEGSSPQHAAAAPVRQATIDSVAPSLVAAPRQLAKPQACAAQESAEAVVSQPDAAAETAPQRRPRSLAPLPQRQQQPASSAESRAPLQSHSGPSEQRQQPLEAPALPHGAPQLPMEPREQRQQQPTTSAASRAPLQLPPRPSKAQPLPQGPAGIASTSAVPSKLPPGPVTKDAGVETAAQPAAEAAAGGAGAVKPLLSSLGALPMTPPPRSQIRRAEPSSTTPPPPPPPRRPEGGAGGSSHTFVPTGRFVSPAAVGRQAGCAISED
eukprot:TRINITY_DN32672_c0_g1_i1.p1 TRINITY_DN32672_c0_g1~~TRINITY_DN32672_c0_g1_i1.p1  ORF type:complete len:748 (+),score=136.80 TRINITY_DN32672_c0_g1_i1:119-2362(+)